ncbi:MAG: endonuclease MutS2, partial [Clostridia bacterium]
MINSLAIKKLELVSVLKEASTYTQSISASEALMSLQPSSDYEKVNFLLAQTNEAKRLINYYGICPGFNFDTIIQVADKAKILSTLTMGELLRVKRMLSTARSVYSSFQSIDDSSIILLPNLASGIYFNKQIEEDIDYAIISEDEMNDRASEELYKIRNAIRKTNDEVKTKLAGYLHSSEMSKYLQDVIITMRQDRYVIPVKSEYRSMVSGLIHDQSASGATVFIEPMAIVTLNNKLKELMISERAEIEHILSEFTKQISCFAKELIANEAILVELDVVYAKAKYGDSIKATMPFVNNYGYINIKFGRHPLIDKNKIVPISVHIGDGFNVLLITGPNTGGKTVSLKTVGLFSLMASCGMMLPCHDESTISIFENIFCDIGDEQSIEQSLSTFSGHINNISKIMENLTDKTLVLIDEVGAGTEPNEGAALALAITEHILKSGSKAILTTHFSQLKEFSMITPNIENASMEFDPVTFAPTYKLIIGVPGSSNAIEIAKRLGLNEEIITSARGKLSEEKVAFENVLRQAESIRQDYEKAKSDVDKLKEELVFEVK